MKKCFLFIIEEKIFGVPMVATRAGWEMFVGPATLVGELSSTKDTEIGVSTRETVEAHAKDFPDEAVNPDLLIKSVSPYGIKTYKALFKECLQMSVEREMADKYKLTPYARLNKKGEVGAEPLDMALFSSGDLGDLGRAVRECISYCR
ncbi:MULTISPECIES: hypothetical protein [Mesorhizobium]|uniref:hypothetical protein n=1 Tax=Mesorhizobium TaxID=68287 RepID=UPI0010A95FC1|nr:MULTISPECIES: hypothetical protein [Mesorhizobium]